MLAVALVSNQLLCHLTVLVLFEDIGKGIEVKKKVDIPEVLQGTQPNVACAY